MAEIDAIANGRVVSPAPLADSPGSSRESLVQKYKASAPPGSQIGSERQGSATTDTNTKDSKKNTKPRFDETNEERLYKRVRTLAMQFGLDIVYLNKHERGGFPILFGVAPINRVLIPGKDEELATVWWALAKYSLSFRSDEQNQYAGFFAVLEKQFSQYFERLNGPLGTLLFFEEAILGISSEIRDQLQEIQHLCGLLLQEIATD